MRRRDRGLLSQIEQAALDERASVASALRKCLILGGRAGSTELREWAVRELQGYKPTDELPEYRKVGAPVLIDGVRGNMAIRGQRYPALLLPEVVRKALNNNPETVPLRDGIGELENLARRRGEEPVKMSLPGGGDIAVMLNYEAQVPFQQIMDVYWAVSPSALRALVDQVRTTLVALVAEMVAALPDDQEIPSSAVADQAVSVAVHGRKSIVTLNVAEPPRTGAAA
jgi:AbiTii